ncbi:THUMP domain-containing protein, partial [Cutibacterium acnes]
RQSLYGLGKIQVIKSQSRIYVEPDSDEYEFDEALNRLRKVFGIVSVSPVWKIESDFEIIKENAIKLVGELLAKADHKTFKVESKRGDKKFPMQSPEISSELGAIILENFHNLNVDVKNPDFILYVEVRESTYIYSEMLPAHGGMPTGTNGKAMLLLSGGIDSPVAGWMIGKRGVEIDCVHFYSYPYT